MKVDVVLDVIVDRVDLVLMPDVGEAFFDLARFFQIRLVRLVATVRIQKEQPVLDQRATNTLEISCLASLTSRNLP